ncbi:hypothetical protein GGH99_001663 [Coemansia sp. RSA 1285]|nr:hypothetical protein GGH99_001663 [Coemansia sp. RSA 1285]
MAEFRYAYLYKNGEQTSCMAAIIDARSAFVAANCINLTNNNNVDTSTVYKIHFSPWNNEKEATYDLAPSQFTIHPNYNPKTLENNIAVIQFTGSSEDNYSGSVSTKDFNGKTKIYVREDYNETSSSWNKPNVVNRGINESDCMDNSPLYTANKYWMTCTSSTNTSMISSDCSIPYGLLYKNNADEAIVMTGIYSHSIMFGNNMCGGSTRILNYFTVLWPYLGFAVNTIGRGVNAVNQNSTFVYVDKDINAMNPPAAADAPTTTLEGGDLYPGQRLIRDNPEESTTELLGFTSSGDDKSTADSTTKEYNSDSIEDVAQSDISSKEVASTSSDESGLSKGTKIAIGVAVPLGVLLVLIVFIVGFHLWKVKRQDKTWDPQAEAMNLRSIAIELHGENENAGLPPYSQANRSEAPYDLYRGSLDESKK